MRDFAAELVDVAGADSRTAARNRSERAAGIVKLWTSSPTIAPIAGTRWAAYNAVTEYVDHYAKVRTHRRRAQRARTAGRHHRQHRTSAEGPSVPDAADPLTARGDPLEATTTPSGSPLHLTERR